MYYNTMDPNQTMKQNRSNKNKNNKAFGLSVLLHAFIWFSHQPEQRQTENKWQEPTWKKAAANESSRETMCPKTFQVLLYYIVISSEISAFFIAQDLFDNLIWLLCRFS